MSDQRLRVAILDDFEKIADTVPAYAKLKARADVTILRERLESSEEIVERLRGFDVLLLMRERTRFSDKEYGRLPGLKLISQTGRTSRHLDLPAATRHGIAVAGTQRFLRSISACAKSVGPRLRVSCWKARPSA
ncbi:MAG: hypothetical protein HYW03_06405 [Deltaproteobacteria bacterium]|nr:hypothetical protein [Deltaproteobacteria bacterium]